MELPKINWSHVLHKYMEELQIRKSRPAFVWYERFGMVVFLLWLFDATIGFKDQAYVQLVYVLSWLLTVIALIDFVWFAYRNRTAGT